MLRELEPEDAETERSLRNAFRWWWLGLILLGVAFVLSYVFPHAHGPAITALLAVVLGVIFYASHKVSVADGQAGSRYAFDVKYGRWLISLISLLLLGLLGVRNLTHLPQTHDPIALAMAIALLLLPFASLVMGPKSEIDDESIRALRSRALRAGYVCAMLTLATVTAVTIYWPAYLIIALAWGLFAASAVPILFYVALDWWSDRQRDG